MRLKDFGILKESKLAPNDAMILHKAKFRKPDEFLADGEAEGVKWKLFKGFEKYFLLVQYGKHSQKLYWDGQLWIAENPHSRETGIFGAEIYDIARTFKEAFKRDFG